MSNASSSMSVESKQRLLLAYAADLELEVDRLRKQGRFIQSAAWKSVKQVQSLCAKLTAPLEHAQPTLDELRQTAEQLADVLTDLRDTSGYHPAHDQVIAIAIRPLMEQVFRWQQRLSGAGNVVLRLELDRESIEWFPGRLRHILDHLTASALSHRDDGKGEMRVTFGVRVSPQGYELRLSDNGKGIARDASVEIVELFHRSAPARAAGLGVGLSIARLLVEQSGGTLGAESNEENGTTIVVILPRFEVTDFLN